VNREPITRDEVENLLLLLAPFAPHMTEELWQKISGQRTADSGQRFQSIHTHQWPKFDPKLVQASTFTLVIQVNGKVRDRVETKRGLTKEKAEELALASGNVFKFIGASAPKQVIYVPDKLINFVV